jgi:4-amino-4-deoxy-L-arabinose transferase-like glycosyltransferase
MWLIVGISFLLFLIGNLPWQLDDYDQAKQAFTSFEMINQGHWLYQTTPHERVATKPPLVGWISAGLFAITRSWEIAWRLPSLLAAAAIAYVIFRVGRSAYGATAGLIAFAAFTLNLFSPRLATLVRTDMPLALTVFLVGILIWAKIRRNEPWSGMDQLKLLGLLTAGMLIKGPVVYAFLFPGMILFATTRWNGGAGRVWPGFWPWIASLGVFALWVGGGIGSVPGFYDQVVLREFLGRFGGEYHRAQPWFFYGPHLLHKFAPWSFLLIAIAAARFRMRPGRVGEWLQNIPAERWWLICWVFGALVVMSVLPSKRVDRIFPIIAPLCLLLGAQVRVGLSRLEFRRNVYRWSAVSLVFGIVFTTSYVVWKVGSGYREHRDALVTFGNQVRKQVDAHGWRYAVVSSSDEGLLLYLRKMQFIGPDRAVSEWNDGKIDALVASAQDAAALIPKLNQNPTVAMRSRTSETRNAEDYVLITKAAP